MGCTNKEWNEEGNLVTFVSWIVILVVLDRMWNQRDSSKLILSRKLQGKITEEKKMMSNRKYKDSLSEDEESYA